ncbi:hypothetical protein V5799_029588 [Amblyomma americanum]|uniref:Transmembrane protein n=1 Tax=Amblyomma americanum TaxID=6943 RepID=A0AAQ4EQK5_AMBAM
MNVSYKSAGKYKHLRGTRAGANFVKIGIAGVVYTAVVGGLMFLVVPHDIIKPFQKPFERKQTRLTKMLDEVAPFQVKKINEDIRNL